MWRPHELYRPQRLLERDSDYGADHEHERGIEVGVRGNRLDVTRIRGGPLHVVGENQSAGTDIGEEFLEVGVVTFLLGVNEQDVDRVFVARRSFVGIALRDDDDVLDSGLFEILAGDGDPAGVNVVGKELAAGLAEGHRKPEARLAGRRAELDDALGANRFGELAEEAAVGC